MRLLIFRFFFFHGFGTLSVFGIVRQIRRLIIETNCFGTLSVFGIVRHNNHLIIIISCFGTLSVFGIVRRLSQVFVGSFFISTEVKADSLI